MHGFSKHENVHFTREIEVEICWKTLNHCIFTNFSLFWIFAIFLVKSKLKTAQNHCVFTNFHVFWTFAKCRKYQPEVWWTLAFSSSLREPPSMLLPILRSDNVLERSTLKFEEPNCHRLVALPQVSIVVQAVEVLLYLPWTAVYASTYCEFGKDFPGQSLLFLDYWVLLLLPRILRVVVVRKPREWAPMRERSMI